MAPGESPRLFLLRIALSVAALALAACSGASDPSPAAEAVEAKEDVRDDPPPDLRLLFLTDPKGYLAPCGCTSRPLGGVDRMAAFVRGLSEEGPPTALLAVGSLFFDGSGHTSLGDDADRWRAETLIDVWNELALDAATPGRLDLTRGDDVIRALAERASFPLLVAGALRDGEEAPSMADRRLLDLGGRKVAVIGAMAELAGGVDASIEAVRRSVESAQADGAARIVVLAHGDRNFGIRVASVEGVDFVVRGGLDSAEALPPTRRGSSVLLHASHHGQGVLVVDLFLGGPPGGALVDRSPWTHEQAASRRAEEAKDLEEKIRGWETDPSVSPDDLAEQRARLAAMERESARSSPPPEAGENAFVARFVELSPDRPKDPSVASALQRFDRRVNDHNRRLFSDLTPPPAAEGEPSYVGSAACARCHNAAFRWWRGHPHGRAYQTLVDRHKEFHLDCVGCHVTGYDRPGGSNVTHNLDGALVDVGCESCHGPGSRHVDDPTSTPATVVRSTEERTCVGCHNEEHSDLFEFEAYRRRLIVPGHGVKVGS